MAGNKKQESENVSNGEGFDSWVGTKYINKLQRQLDLYSFILSYARKRIYIYLASYFINTIYWP